MTSVYGCSLQRLLPGNVLDSDNKAEGDTAHMGTALGPRRGEYKMSARSVMLSQQNFSVKFMEMRQINMSVRHKRCKVLCVSRKGTEGAEGKGTAIHGLESGSAHEGPTAKRSGTAAKAVDAVVKVEA